jgi:hypothetical protein
VADLFEQHGDAEIYRSQPGLGEILGARGLGEFSDDTLRDRQAVLGAQTLGHERAVARLRIALGAE